MELVPSYHPGVTCDGCGLGPITGSRFKCKQCNNFDFCERCFSIKRTHKHTFNRFAEPNSTGLFLNQIFCEICLHFCIIVCLHLFAAVFAGRPGRRRHRSSGLDSSTTSMALSTGPQGKSIFFVKSNFARIFLRLVFFKTKCNSIKLHLYNKCFCFSAC